MRKVEGSMTVEASLLMPMVIFILAGLCYSFFFMHDYIVMQNGGVSADRGRIMAS